MGLPVVRTGNVALDRFLEQVREYIETSKGGGNPKSQDRVLRVSDLPSVIALATAGVKDLPKQYTQSEMEKFAADLSNTRVFQSLTSQGSALDGVIDGYPRQTLADVRAVGGKGTASVVSEAIVSSTDTQALAAQVTTVEASLTGLEGDIASVETAYLALASDVGGLEAQYTIKVRAGGAIAGIGLAATSSGEAGATSSVVISADKFAVVAAGSSGIAGAKVPFSIDTGTGKVVFTADVQVTGDLLVGGTISTTNINTTGQIRSTGSYTVGVGAYKSAVSGENSTSGFAESGLFGYGYHGVRGFTKQSDATGASLYGMTVNDTSCGMWLCGRMKWTHVTSGNTYQWDPPTGSAALYLRDDGQWGAPATGSVSWGDVTDKPTTFPPETHTHSYATASDITAAINDNNTSYVSPNFATYEWLSSSTRTITIPGVGTFTSCSIT